MATKVYLTGNYLTIGEGDPKIEGFASETFVSSSGIGADKYYNFVQNGSVIARILASEIVDENGDAYADFEAWKDANTGNSRFATSEKQDIGNTSLASIDESTKNKVSSLNSSATTLLSGQIFTGVWEDVSRFNSITLACLSSTNGTLTAQFSADGTNVHSTLNYTVNSNLNEVHRLTITRRFFRLIFTNSATNQTSFSLQAIYGQQQALTSPMNIALQSDSDAMTVRELDFNLLVAEGLYQNRVATIKDGLNTAISTATVPEDLCNQGGVYAGFPTGTPQAGQVVVAGADNGTLFYSYLAAPTDTDYTFASVAINGANTYNLGHNIWRCNFAYFVASSPTATNVGQITIRNSVTTTNVFVVIDAGYGQSFCAAYTVPASSSVYIDRICGTVRGSTSGFMDGFFWFRDSVNAGYRLRFPFELQFGALYFDDIDYLIKIPAGTDFIPRIITSSANNLQAKVSYRILKVKEA